MGILHDDVVLLRQSEKEGEPSVITVNCPDKTGLGSDLCRIILFFGLTVVRIDVSTDGKWCYLVFWVIGKPNTRWSLLKKRLVGVCPSCSSASGILYYQAELQSPRPPDVFLLKFCCYDRRGLLHDVTAVLYELELIIERVKISTTPDGKVMDLFFITDTRELLHTKKRQEDTYDNLKSVLGDAMISCEIEMVGPEVTVCSQGPSFLPPEITEDMFDNEVFDEHRSGSPSCKKASIAVDNLLSPSHTLIQIVCQDHKGFLYDIMRTLKDYNIQISYARFTMKSKMDCELDLFIMQADGKKIVDPNKLNALCSRIQMELRRPLRGQIILWTRVHLARVHLARWTRVHGITIALRVALVNRGPDTELLVANPVELSGKGRPLVFHDITLALKMLSVGVFSAEIGRYMVGDREWEIYRVLLEEGNGLPVPKTKIQEAVWKMLMGWE